MDIGSGRTEIIGDMKLYECWSLQDCYTTLGTQQSRSHRAYLKDFFENSDEFQEAFARLPVLGDDDESVVGTHRPNNQHVGSTRNRSQYAGSEPGDDASPSACVGSAEGDDKEEKDVPRSGASEAAGSSPDRGKSKGKGKRSQVKPPVPRSVLNIAGGKRLQISSDVLKRMKRSLGKAA